MISSTIKKHTSLVFAIGLVCCTTTAAVIIVFSFYLAMSISKPLKNVIRVANFINDNAGNKEAISQIISDVGGLPEVKYLLYVFQLK
ncbi:MAG: hypothetical protein KDC72_09375 [Bacteroidetes bacterium]|nr:hypothetical protein [Bacteroidota bacterium]